MHHFRNELGVVTIILSFLLASGCMWGPTDQTEVSARNHTFIFSGYTFGPNEVVSVEARRSNTEAWSTIATATTTTPPFRLFGYDAYRWTVTGQVPDSYWASGETGFLTHLKTSAYGQTLYTMKPGALECYGMHANDYYDFVANCAANNPYEAVVCTTNYRPLDNRRGYCSPRILRTTRERAQQVSHELPSPSSYASARPYSYTANEPLSLYTYSSSNSSTHYIGIGNRLQSVSWRGDPTVELELISGPVFAKRYPTVTQETIVIETDEIDPFDGPTTGYGIRAPWTLGATSDAIDQVDVYAWADSLNLPYTLDAIYRQNTIPTSGPANPPGDWAGPHAVRLVDRGECSGTVPWADVAEFVGDAFYIEFASILGKSPDPSIKGVRSEPGDRLTPGIMVAGAREAGFRFQPELYIWGKGPWNTRGAWVHFDLWVTLGAYDGQLTATVEKFDAEVTGGSKQARDSISSGINNKKPKLSDLSAALTGYLAGFSVEIRRVIARPSGLELVLAESVDDSQYDSIESAANLQAAGVDLSYLTGGIPIDLSCTRPGSASSKTYYGAMSLPNPERWFPQFQTRWLDGPTGPPDGWVVSQQAIVPSYLPRELLQALTRVEDAPAGVEIRACWYEDTVRDLFNQGDWAYVADSFVTGNDPDCEGFSGSLVMRRR